MNLDSASLPKLELQLFGSPLISRNGIFIPKLTSTKAQGRLYVLAMTGRAHTRTTLASSLWSRSDEDLAARMRAGNVQRSAALMRGCETRTQKARG